MLLVCARAPLQGHWSRFLLQPYAHGAGSADLFAWRPKVRWQRGGQGWEASGCFLPLRQYPRGWNARGGNVTNLQVCPCVRVWRG
jgi:hypothetical protein